MHAFFRAVPLLLAAAGALAQVPAPAPASELPKDLHGRWTGTPQGGRAPSQTFDLENIQRKEADSFAARLSWTASDPKCSIRYQPVIGRVTAKGLALDAAMPCGSVGKSSASPTPEQRRPPTSPRCSTRLRRWPDAAWWW